MDKVQLSLKSMKGFLCLVLSGLLMSCKLTEPQKTIQLESRSDNTLWVIHPYRDWGTWVFDDPRVGLRREPFVAGIPEMMDKLVRDIPNADKASDCFFQLPLSPIIQPSLYGGGRRPGGIGISLWTMMPRDGFVRRSLTTSRPPPKRSMSGQRRGKLRSE
jgi:hypothetical protein